MNSSIVFCWILLLSVASAFVPLQQREKSPFLSSPWGVTHSTLFAASDASSGDALKIIISGAPASGKGTQCEMIKEKYGVIHLSTGDMLRAAVADQTEVGKLAKEYMDSGKLVPDDVIIGVVSKSWLLGALRFMFRYLFCALCDRW